jgi:curli biogenesis system outer membrane secretion channel CsgG
MRLTSVTILLLAGLAVAQVTPSPSPQNSDPTVVASGKALSQIKRIYVESFGDDPISKEMQAMVVDSLTKSKVFAVTENRDKADAILKGSTLEKTSQEAHSYSDGTSVRVAQGSVNGSVHGSIHGSSSGDLSGSLVDGTGTIHGSSSGSIDGSTDGSIHGSSSSTHMADSTSTSSVNTVNDARASVRLVNSDGDVIWTTTQESKGAKYKGASADVADKIVKQLIWAVAKPVGTSAN